MKELDEFLPSINPFAPGCAAPTAYFAIRQAAIEFCEKTRLWRYEDEFTVTETVESIAVPFGAVVHEFELVRFNGQDLAPKSADWLDQRMPGWRDGALTGTPVFITQTEPGTLRLVPFEEGTVKLYLWLKPAQDCDEVPDFLVDLYREVIAHGALARILAMPAQPFSNANLAVAFASSFNDRVAGLSVQSSRGQQRARTRTRASFY